MGMLKLVDRSHLGWDEFIRASSSLATYRNLKLVISIDFNILLL